MTNANLLRSHVEHSGQSYRAIVGKCVFSGLFLHVVNKAFVEIRPSHVTDTVWAPSRKSKG